MAKRLPGRQWIRLDGSHQAFGVAPAAPARLDTTCHGMLYYGASATSQQPNPKGSGLPLEGSGLGCNNYYVW
jgi:hypothetical protein